MDEETQVVDAPVSETPASVPEATHTPTAEPTPAAPERTGPSYQDRVGKLKGAAYDHYRKTGNLDEAEAKMPGRPAKNSDATADSSTATPGTPRVQTETASGTVEPKPTRQDRDWVKTRQRLAELERENIALKAETDVYKRESAARGTPAPATTETKPVDAQAKLRPRPARPNINDFDDPTKYHAAEQAWHADDTRWIEEYYNYRSQNDRATTQHEQATQSWNTQIETGRKTHKDFDEVAFNSKLPISYVTLGLLQSLPDGALRSYALGKNLEDAARIAEATHIPGEAEFKSYADFMNWVRSDPNVAIFYGQKLAIAQMELAKLPLGPPSAPPKEKVPPKPLKEVIAGQAKPSAEVNIEETAGPVGDPVANALKIAKENGDPTEYKRLMNERDLKNRKR